MLSLNDPSLLRNSAFINGSFGARSENGEVFAVINPATMETIGDLPDLDAKACVEAVEAAVGAASELSRMSARSRGQLLHAWYTLTMNSVDDLAAIITAENGKPIAEARGEAVYAADYLRWFAEEATRIEGSVIQASDKANRIITIKQPIGVVGIITPWNFPAAMITRKVGAALAAGCPVVVKPAAETPLTALALAELADRAGMPAGALNVLTTHKHTVTVGQVLTQNPNIRKFSFTGSTAVGKRLAAQCSSTIKKTSLELGGNAPVIVFDDGDLDQAAAAIMSSKFRNTGQTCICPNRIYIQSGVYEKLAELLLSKIKELRSGNGADSNTTLGPLISPAAVQKTVSHVEDAIQHGAQLLYGGKAATSFGPTFMEPTLLGNVLPSSRCVREEIFGPLVALLRFGDEKEVLNQANDTALGLAGYVFTRDVSRAWRVAEALELGMVGINTGTISDIALPFGGIKESGQGKEGSKFGIEEYLISKSITFRL